MRSVGRSVSKRRQIGSGRDFGSEERTRLFTERGTILDATAVARRSFFPRSFVRQVFSENLTPIQTSAAHPSCMHVYASTSHAQHLACPEFMHHLPKHNCTYLYHLHSLFQASSPLTLTYKDELTRDKVDDVDRVNMTGYASTLYRGRSSSLGLEDALISARPVLGLANVEHPSPSIRT